MNSEAVPAEIWIEIFQLLSLPSDLYSVMRSCKRFHDLAIRSIHRHVIWRTPEQMAHNLPVWDANEGMHLATRTLELGVSLLPGHCSGFVVDFGGLPIHMRSRERNFLRSQFPEQQSYASPNLHRAMLQRITSFGNLENLTFYGLLLTPEHFKLIHALPLLRALHVDSCVVPCRSTAQTLSHQTLPITELALLNLRRRGPDPHGELLIEEDMMHVLTLSLAQNLRTLRVDSTADVFKYVFSVPSWGAQTNANEIPPHLERLYIQRKRLVLPSIAGESAFPDSNLYSFLSRARSLTTYSTYHPTPHHQHLRPGTLPLLRCYSGPVESIAGILPNRPIVALQLLQCTHGQYGLHNHRDGISALTNIATAFPDLQMLSVEFSTWDDEIMHAICSLFHKLRRLKITYEHGGPSEMTMVTMGPEFLARFPEMHKLQIYATPQHDIRKPAHPPFLFDASFDSIEEELRNLVIPWNRWCPALREVQLSSGYVMRRGYDGGVWHLYRLKRLEEFEEFHF
ncbi:uncharacterized protein LAESUDRAFT_650157 [Laetiporus sulphureus 93-53]|uniref:F-box domain-containing protein n=1 Tax=Laetiporus sulphureus 93-53 TaxID=1314785 RepID=A0A165EW01_9APHY|nr:uncharacterized protein LAESUDRAFT_650157 [Laetiporus sulphureus 93-53]KZT07883.1 hypothetical protein LAESUDRAFT_650157 [Laetiporus sulphureus 93-53]